MFPAVQQFFETSREYLRPNARLENLGKPELQSLGRFIDPNQYACLFAVLWNSVMEHYFSIRKQLLYLQFLHNTRFEFLPSLSQLK